MTIKNRKELKKELMVWKKEKSSMPYPKPEPLPVTKATEFEQMIKKHCDLLAGKYGLQIDCSIIDVKGTWVPEIKRFTKNGTTNGVADVHITYKGRTHWVEVKFKKDYQKPDQKEFQARQEAAGATYGIVKVPGDWFAFINRLIHQDE